MSQQSILVVRFPKRLNAMIKRSEDFQTQFKSEEPIYVLLGQFAAFSREYVELLKKVPETISRNSFVVNNGIEKLLQEWNILSRASEQRLIGGLKEDLDRASNLAQTYCDKWNDILQDKPYRKLQTPVVYFEKLFRISRSIYAPQIPVISIPLTDYDQPENWQSLAHEFSHHIFWNGFNPDQLSADQISSTHQKLSENISTRLQASKPRVALWKNWLEEVFADVYGTLLAGSSYAISAQDRMAEQVNSVDDFLIADHHHPCVYLRPFISIYTLDFIADKENVGQAEIEILKKRWSEFSKPGSQLKYKNIPVATLAQDARKVVEIILGGGYWPVPFNPVEKLADPIGTRDNFLPLEPVVDQDPLILMYPALDSITLPTTFEIIKQRLIEISTQVVQQLGLPRLDEDTKLLAWLSLTGLELSDTRDYHVHGCREDHRHAAVFWLKRHRHPQDGSSVESC
jgi:hypothetical protein